MSIHWILAWFASTLTPSLKIALSKSLFTLFISKPYRHSLNLNKSKKNHDVMLIYLFELAKSEKITEKLSCCVEASV